MSIPRAPTSATRSTFFPSHTNNISGSSRPNSKPPPPALMDTHDQAIRDHQRTEEEEAQRRVAAATMLEFSRNPVGFPLQDPHVLVQQEDAEMTNAGDGEWATTEEDSGSVAAADADAEMSDSQATEILEGGFRRRGEGRNQDAEDSDSDLTDILNELTPPTSPANVGGQSVIPAPRRARRGSPSPEVEQAEIRHGKNWWRDAQAQDAAEMSDDDEPRSLEQIEWITLMALGPQKTREKMRRQLRGEQGDEVEEQERMYALEEPIVISSDDEDEDYAAKKKRKTKASKGKGKGKQVIPDEA